MQRRTFVGTAFAALGGRGRKCCGADLPVAARAHRRAIPARGGTDTLVRAVQEPMQKALGGTIVIDNKGGGGAASPTNSWPSSRPDGHWMVVSANNLPLYPYILAKLGFDAKSAFVPIGFIAKQDSVLVGSADAPWADLKAIIAAAAKAAPGSVAIRHGRAHDADASVDRTVRHAERSQADACAVPRHRPARH